MGTPISLLPGPATTLDGTELFALVQGGVTKRGAGSLILSQTPAGTAAAPSLAFTGGVGYTDKGFYSIGADSFGASTAGVLRLTISAAAITSTLPVTVPDGSAGAPGVRLTTDASGMYRVGSGILGFSVSGTLRMYVQSTGLWLPGAAGVINQGTTDFGIQIRGLMTTPATPAFDVGNGNAFTGSSTAQVGTLLAFGINQTSTAGFTALKIMAGLAVAGTGTPLFGSAGGLFLDCQSNSVSIAQITAAGALLGGAGSMSLPSHSFFGDSDSGMYNSAANTLAWATGGGVRMTLTSAVLALNSGIVIRGNQTTGTLGAHSFDNLTSLTGASAAQLGCTFSYTLNQSGSSSFEGLRMATTETALGSGVQYLYTGYAGAAGASLKFSVSNAGGIAYTAVTTAAAAATENDYAGFGQSTFARTTANAGNTVCTGILATNVPDGRMLIIVNPNATTWTFNNQDAGSTAANRIITTTGAAVVLAQDDCLVLVYDLTTARWRQITTLTA